MRLWEKDAVAREKYSLSSGRAFDFAFCLTVSLHSFSSSICDESVIEAKLISLCNGPVSCSKQPALHPQLLFCPSGCLPAADLSDSGA